jgi:hypothetical protein
LEPSGIERAGFNELEQSRLIFGPAGLQGCTLPYSQSFSN